jgi:Ca2+-binding RTX toxin-like protein
MNGGGLPDLVVGSSAYKYEDTDDQGGGFGQNHPACDDTAAPDTCMRSGRAYTYSGENIVGSVPATPLGTPTFNIRNPLAQADDPNTLVINQLELLGHSVAPVGDVGSCTQAGAPGTDCPPPNATGVLDGRPEVLISAFRVDYPLTGPDNPLNYEIGANLMVDGATGRILQTYTHPDPQPGSIFGFTIANMPAVGNMGLSAAPPVIPDVYIPAVGQDTDEYRGEGIGFVMNGSTVVNGNITDLVRFRDPFPATSGSFGSTAAGVGDLVGDGRNEILLGEFSTHNPPQNDQVISDVHFFDPVTGDPLQSIRDPDRQLVSNFGTGVAPMGDLNEDGFLDFAVGAARYDRDATTLDTGRAYIFRSNNTNPAVTPPPADGGGGARSQAPQYPGPAPTLADCAGGKNVIAGTNGNDRRTGSLGADLMFGGTGDDVLDALAGDDCIDLGPGTDRGQGGAGNDLVLGGTGDDPVVDGSSGNDRLNGNSGNDRVSGGLGVDRVFGDIGNDRLSGGFGNDVLHGARGRDRISGSRGRDRVNGGAGRDVISAGSSGDRVAGDQGNDRINGNSGNDLIRGNSGADRISGSSGADRISGGSGNDRVGARDGRRDRIACGRGRDRVVADRIDRVARDCERVRRG